ncbi:MULTISPECIES: TrkA family potassium uptake protein [unclassified Pseudodesulfovibrio]|uniref:potassium channel family protein n=1 Tax=unclassified Pseudodesulfovibrio TaxID=2661612 RepID=UPI000FEBE9E4|nr:MULTISPECIES: TrkA family potassium uptake protein [unclassified Pseudodesulfovibrio]MCJ2164201.1 TrkA family potassium uptake protein [Pseudodesulfovibrio sp. S3-i]RWU05175.1 TrkA family potassium uptake protein [Pseudodesulfovibrio sp. S3]
MANKKEIGVIGLGKFGFSLARALTELGHAVVGVDRNPDNVRKAQDIMAQVYEADATDEKMLVQTGFGDLDKVIVSTGDSMEASILVVLNLQAIGVKNIWVKAISEEHERVLYKLGVPFVVFPEAFVAFQLAHRIAMPGIQEYFGMGKDVVTREIIVDAWAGKTLRDLNLTNTYNVQVVAFRQAGDSDFHFVPQADRIMEAGDVLVLLGKTSNVMQIEKF